MAASEAVIVYFTMWRIYGQALFTTDQSLYPLGDMTFTACVIVIATKLQVIEQRYRTYMAVAAWISAVGGWFLWNIVLAATYHNSKYPEYYVKGSFFYGFGRSFLWWFTLVVSVTACLLFEAAVRALKCAFFPTDVEIFQTLESDLGVRQRFEEASAAWLQEGWRRASKKTTWDLENAAAAQAKREGEVQELLMNRPRAMEDGHVDGLGVQTEEQMVMVDDGPGRRSVDIHEMLSRRFGSIRRGSMA